MLRLLLALVTLPILLGLFLSVAGFVGWRATLTVDSYPNYSKVRSRLIPGARVRLWALPRRDRWRPRIWGWASWQYSRARLRFERWKRKRRKRASRLKR